MRDLAVVWVSSVLLFAAGCGGSPTTPGGGGGSTGQSSCRNYVTASSQVTQSPQYVATIASTGSFNSSTFQLTAPFAYSDTQGTTFTTNQVLSYPSIADFVDEVSVIPPLTRWTGLTITSTGSSGTVTTTNTNSFDGQKRWTQNLANTPGTASVITTYTAWDSAGRATAGNLTTGAGLTTIAFTYNDAARTQTQTSSTPGFATYVGVSTFDANGNMTQNVATVDGATVANSTVTIVTTGRVCK
jgi:hypothetical protein